MNKNNIKLNDWVYGFAAIALVLACFLTTVVVYQTFPSLPGALEEKVDIGNLTQVVVPGSADINFSKPGAYGVYYEYRSLVKGVNFETSRQPPSLECALTSRSTGAAVPAAHDFVETNTYSSKDQKRAGVLVMSINVDDPGIYTFACQYPDGSLRPEIVVAVGPNLMWEFFNILAKAGGSILSGIAVFTLSVLVCSIILLILFIKRAQAKKRIDA